MEKEGPAAPLSELLPTFVAAQKALQYLSGDSSLRRRLVVVRTRALRAGLKSERMSLSPTAGIFYVALQPAAGGSGGFSLAGKVTPNCQLDKMVPRRMKASGIVCELLRWAHDHGEDPASSSFIYTVMLVYDGEEEAKRSWDMDLPEVSVGAGVCLLYAIFVWDRP